MIQLPNFLSWLDTVPVWETVLFLVLALITVYRRKLSSNDTYRSDKENQRQNGQKRKQITRGNSSFVSLKHISTKNNFDRISAETLFEIASYLTTDEIIRFSLCSKKLRVDLMSDALWKELWIQSFGGIWNSEFVCSLRALKDITWQPSEPTIDGEVVNISTVLPAGVSWFQFFVMFETEWIDFISAGFCTADKAVIAMDNKLYDISDFLSEHPGSPETLAEHAGCDVTVLYREIGHSSSADSMRTNLMALDPSARSVTRRSSAGTSYCHSKLQEKLQIVKKALLTWQSSISLNNDNNNNIVDLLAPLEYWASARCETTLFARHCSPPKAFFDPLSWRWAIWFSCCGRVKYFPVTSTVNDVLNDDNKTSPVQLPINQFLRQLLLPGRR
jgi:hypothetical protein